MRAKHYPLLQSLLIVCVVFPGGAPWAGNDRLPASLDVYTNNAYPVLVEDTLVRRGVKTAVYNLQAIANIEATLSRDLPADPTAAARIATERLKHVDAEAIRKNYLANVAVAKYGLTKVPAIVINNGESVIYGITDLNEVVALWRSHTLSGAKP